MTTFNAFKRRPAGIILSLALAATLAVAGPARAETAGLRIGDLDLTTESGQSELNRRLDAAALKACPSGPSTGTNLRHTPAQRRCMTDVRKQLEGHVARRSESNRLGR